MIVICADLDLGVIDGATVWMQSLALTLARRNDVTVFSRAPVQRDALTRPLLAQPRIRLVLPDRVLSQSQLVDAAAQIEADVVIVRGLALCRRAARQFPGRLWAYLTDVPQRVCALTAATRGTITAIAAASRHVLCQTEALRTFLESYVPGVDGKALLLPPMIPDTWPARAPRDDGVLRLGYAGKLAPAWRTLEMVETTAALRAAGHALELHVVGDKLFGPSDWTERMHRAITTTPGVIWHRGRARDEALAVLAGLDVALGVRAPELDDSLELSTKLLEYGALGVPALINRTPMHEQLLGADYPLFADDLAATLLRARDPALRRIAAARGQSAARPFTFDAVGARLQPWLAATGAPLPDFARPKLPGADRRVGLLDPTALRRALRVLGPGDRLHVLGTPPADPAWFTLANTRDVSVDGPAPLGPWLRKIGTVAATDAESAQLAATSGARTIVLPLR